MTTLSLSTIPSLSRWSSIKFPLFVYAGGVKKVEIASVGSNEKMKKMSKQKTVREMVNLRVPGEEKESTIPYLCCVENHKAGQPRPLSPSALLHLNSSKHDQRKKILKKINLVTVPVSDEPNENEKISRTSLKLRLERLTFDGEKVEGNAEGNDGGKFISFPTVKRLSLKELEKVNRKCTVTIKRVLEKEKRGRKSNRESKGEKRLNSTLNGKFYQNLNHPWVILEKKTTTKIRGAKKLVEFYTI